MPWLPFRRWVSQNGYRTVLNWQNTLSTVYSSNSDNSEVHLTFDRYALPLSLKSATRDTRQGGQLPVLYHITDLAEKSMSKRVNNYKTWLLHEDATAKQLTRKYATLKVTKKKQTQSCCCMLLTQQPPVSPKYVSVPQTQMFLYLL